MPSIKKKAVIQKSCFWYSASSICLLSHVLPLPFLSKFVRRLFLKHKISKKQQYKACSWVLFPTIKETYLATKFLACYTSVDGLQFHPPPPHFKSKCSPVVVGGGARFFICVHLVIFGSSRAQVVIFGETHFKLKTVGYSLPLSPPRPQLPPLIWLGPYVGHSVNEFRKL